MKVSIDRKGCNGCTICNITCPEIFSIDDEGKAKTSADEVPFRYEELCIEAVDECPEGSITVDDDRYATRPGSIHVYVK